MVLISRKRLIDRKTNVRDTKLYIIATEGEKTESQYFEIFQNPKIRVVVIPTPEEGQSAPVHVLGRLDQFKIDYDLDDEDELWLMIDVDHRRARELKLICQAANQKGVRLAVSNPCFEIWLYLHFADLVTTYKKCKEVEIGLRQLLGSYNKTNLDLNAYRPHVIEAIERAKAMHHNSEERWPVSMGTHVYKVVENLV